MRKKYGLSDVIFLMLACLGIGVAATYYTVDKSLSSKSSQAATQAQERAGVSGAQKTYVDWKNGILLKDAHVFKKDADVVIGFLSDGGLTWGYISSDKDNASLDDRFTVKDIKEAERKLEAQKKVKQIAKDLADD